MEMKVEKYPPALTGPRCCLKGPWICLSLRVMGSFEGNWSTQIFTLGNNAQRMENLLRDHRRKHAEQQQWPELHEWTDIDRLFQRGAELWVCATVDVEKGQCWECSLNFWVGQLRQSGQHSKDKRNELPDLLIFFQLTTLTHLKGCLYYNTLLSTCDQKLFTNIRIILYAKFQRSTPLLKIR